MKLHIHDINATDWKLVDADTGEIVHDVIWADDEAGELERYYRDKDGKYVVRYDEVMTEFLQGQSIRFVPKVLNA